MRRLESVRIKRLLGVFVFAFATIAMQFASVQFASAATTATWNGTAGDGKFSTAGNWQGGVVPVAGDILVLPGISGSTDQAVTLNNDLAVSFGGVTFQSVPSIATIMTNYQINSLSLADGAVWSTPANSNNYNSLPALKDDAATTITAGGNLAVVGFSSLPSQATITIGGNLTIGSVDGVDATYNLNLGVNCTVTGNIIVNKGSSYLPSSGRHIILNGGNITTLDDFADSITVNGIGSNVSTMTYGAVKTITISSDIILNENLQVWNSANATMKFTGSITYNGHTITKAVDAAGELIIGSQAIVSAEKSTHYDTDEPTLAEYVGDNETSTLDGVRGYVQVFSGGILNGTGSAQTIIINSGGVVAPGHSPGKLTVTQSFFLNAGSTYQAQLQNSTAGGYDQVQVSDPSRTTGNDVVIDPAAILDTSLYSGYAIKQGDKFIIINNLQPSSQLVTGTFTGLVEGAQFKVGNVTFSISYIGGDGNDVVLTALNTGSDPKAPNTGVARIVTANPAVSAGLGLLTAGGLFIAGRRRLNK